MYIPRSKLECPKTQTPLTNGVRGPYCKLRTEFFPIDLWPKRKVRGPYIEGNKRGLVTYSTDRENEVSKIFIISLLFALRVRERFLFTRKLQITDASRKQNESI